MAQRERDADDADQPKTSEEREQTPEGLMPAGSLVSALASLTEAPHTTSNSPQAAANGGGLLAHATAGQRRSPQRARPVAAGVTVVASSSSEKSLLSATNTGPSSAAGPGGLETLVAGLGLQLNPQTGQLELGSLQSLGGSSAALQRSDTTNPLQQPPPNSNGAGGSRANSDGELPCLHPDDDAPLETGSFRLGGASPAAPTIERGAHTMPPVPALDTRSYSVMSAVSPTLDSMPQSIGTASKASDAGLLRFHAPSGSSGERRASRASLASGPSPAEDPMDRTASPVPYQPTRPMPQWKDEDFLPPAHPGDGPPADDDDEVASVGSRGRGERKRVAFAVDGADDSDPDSASTSPMPQAAVAAPPARTPPRG